MMKRQSYRLSRLAYLTKLLRTWYGPHLKRPQFNDLTAECKKILTSIVKMLERKAIEIAENPEPEPKVDNKPGPEVDVIVRRDFLTAHGSCRVIY